MPGAVREIQQTKGETRFLVSLHRGSFPLVIPFTGAGKHGYYLRDLKVKWRHEARSPDIPALGIGEQAGTPQPLWLPHSSAPWAEPLSSMLGHWIHPLAVGALSVEPGLGSDIPGPFHPKPFQEPTIPAGHGATRSHR